MADEQVAASTGRGVIHLEVVTPVGASVRADVDQVEAPSVDGEFGVLPGHLPLLAALKAGVVRYRSAGKTFVVAVGPGFAEAGPDKMSILTDRCVEAGDVDVAAARTGLAEANSQLDALQGTSESPERIEAARNAEWFQAQLDAAKEVGKA